MIDRVQVSCQKMKEKLFEVKEEMHNKDSEIVKEVKQKGKEVLNKVSEFFGEKKKLESIRENVRESIIETDVIRKYRKEVGLTQEQMARRLHQESIDTA